MSVLFVSDLDGTLLNNEAAISENSKDLLNKAISNGVLFTAATARTYSSAVPIFSGVHLNCPLILLNGAIIYDAANERTVKAEGIEKNTAEKVLNIFFKHGKHPLVYLEKDSRMTVEYTTLETPNQKRYVQSSQTYKKHFSHVSKYSLQADSKIVYIVSLDKKENLLPLHEELLGIDGIGMNFYSDTYSGEYFLEISAAGVSKAKAMLEVKKMLNASKAIAFGDNLNDIAMFKMADEAYAMENACDELKRFATGVIGKNTEDAVASFIYKRSKGENI